MLKGVSVALQLGVPNQSWLGAPYRRTDGHYYHLELIRVDNPTCVKHAPTLSVGSLLFLPNLKHFYVPENDFSPLPFHLFFPF